MTLSEFTIGTPFFCNGDKWLCTDKGSRTIAAIRLNKVRIMTDDGHLTTLSEEDARQTGWLAGPPYAVNEILFDENDQEGCSLSHDAISSDR